MCFDATVPLQGVAGTEGSDMFRLSSLYTGCIVTDNLIDCVLCAVMYYRVWQLSRRYDILCYVYCLCLSAGCVVTGAEDGSLFAACFDAATPLQGGTSTARMGEQAAGAAVKALAAAPVPGIPGKDNAVNHPTLMIRHRKNAVAKCEWTQLLRAPLERSLGKTDDRASVR